MLVKTHSCVCLYSWVSAMKVRSSPAIYSKVPNLKRDLINQLEQMKIHLSAETTTVRNSRADEILLHSHTHQRYTHQNTKHERTEIKMVEMREAKGAAEGKVELTLACTHAHMHAHNARTSERAGRSNRLLLWGLPSKGRDPSGHMSSLLPLQSTTLPQDIPVHVSTHLHPISLPPSHTRTHTKVNWANDVDHACSCFYQSMHVFLCISPRLCSSNIREGAAAMQR